MLGHYILAKDGRTPVRVRSLLKWARWFETSAEARRVAYTELPGEIGDISTVFLALDHSFSRGHRPVLFETMSFIGMEQGDYSARYCTWAEAEEGHARIVAEVLARIEQTAAQIGAIGVTP